MYNYSHYKEQDKEVVLAFMRQHNFVMLIAADNSGRAEATQVPVMVEERGDKLFITGHIARKSDHQNAMAESGNALLVFTGPHAYVSGAWYSNPQQASTWNYIAVHARGNVRWTDEVELIAILKKLSLHFENYDANSSPFYDNLPVEYVAKLVKAIVGFEIEVTELDNVYKLSQNRDEKSYDTIVEKLKQQEGDAKLIAEIMEERKPGVFNPGKDNS
ncbi:MAG: FMN-binding negative transcriptional regulator [Chitinophagaceae bacterium]|nr:FMN-binding negative transcriptional regulator [Chitinophagaceae bacterium]